MPIRTAPSQGRANAIYGRKATCVRVECPFSEGYPQGSHVNSWYQSCPGGANYVKHEEVFQRHTWDFKKSAEALPAGNYEWPFDMILAGSTPESLEGLHDSWIIYRMKATIERGMLQQNSVARKQVRIIRSLDPTALELAHSMVRSAWPIAWAGG